MASGRETILLIPEKKCRRNIPTAHVACPLGLDQARRLLSPRLELWAVWGLTDERPRLEKLAARLGTESFSSQGSKAGAGLAGKPHRSRSRVSWVTVRSPMENSSSQGSRIQASRAVSCSGHTTRRAQKLSSRDTWKASGSEGRLVEDLPPLPASRPAPAPGLCLPQKTQTSGFLSRTLTEGPHTEASMCTVLFL